MSPSKKKAARSTAKKSRAKAKSAKSAKKKKKAARKSKKKAKPAKSASRKTTAKKSTKAASKAKGKSKAKTTARKAAAKTTARKAAKAPAKKKAAPKKATAKTPTKKASRSAAQTDSQAPSRVKTKAKARNRGGATKSSKRVRAKKPVTPTGPRHPKLGYKWVCFDCGTKFYDLGKEEPICPKCETDQRARPPEDLKPTVQTPKPKVVRPMAQLLDDEEPAASREEDVRPVAAAPAQNEMFDEAESDGAGLDIDDADAVDDAQEPPEIDVV